MKTTSKENAEYQEEKRIYASLEKEAGILGLRNPHYLKTEEGELVVNGMLPNKPVEVSLREVDIPYSDEAIEKREASV